MTKKTLILTTVVVVIVAIVVTVLVVTKKKMPTPSPVDNTPAPSTQTATTTSERAPVPPPSALSTDPGDASNEALQTDLTSVDDQLKNLNSDSSAFDSAMSGRAGASPTNFTP